MKESVIARDYNDMELQTLLQMLYIYVSDKVFTPSFSIILKIKWFVVAFEISQEGPIDNSLVIQNTSITPGTVIYPTPVFLHPNVCKKCVLMNACIVCGWQIFQCPALSVHVGFYVSVTFYCIFKIVYMYQQWCTTVCLTNHLTVCYELSVSCELLIKLVYTSRIVSFEILSEQEKMSFYRR